MNRIDSIYEEFDKIRSEIEISIEKMKSDLGNMINKIVLYGAGSAGIAFLKYLNDAGIYPVCFADGKPEKQGQFCEGLEIISPENIAARFGADALVIVTINTDGKRYCKSFENRRAQRCSQAAKRGGLQKRNRLYIFQKMSQPFSWRSV